MPCCRCSTCAGSRRATSGRRSRRCWARAPRTCRHRWSRGCGANGKRTLLAFYDYPAEHWDHLRTANPIESVFATVRHRTVRTKGALSQDTARLVVFKLVMAAAKTWRRLKGENQLPKVVQGVTFRDGVEVTDTPAQTAA